MSEIIYKLIYILKPLNFINIGQTLLSYFNKINSYKNITNVTDINRIISQFQKNIQNYEVREVA